MRTRPVSLIVLILLCVSVPPRQQAIEAANVPYDTAFVRWRAADDGFAMWTKSGTVAVGGTLQLEWSNVVSEPDPYPAGTYYGGNFYNGDTYVVGEAVGPETTTGSMPVQEAVASWNADTPPGTWMETLIRARVGTRWTKWYNLGVWASDSSAIARHSVSAQGDADGYVAVDTLVLDRKVTADALQLKVRLFSENQATPTLRNLGLTFASSVPKKADASTGDASLWNTLVPVPECSQMVYPDGGTVWCSPTSTSMVLGYWNQDNGPCEPRVRAAVAGVYDWRFGGHGNWPFNTAYAAQSGLEAYVVRFSSMAQLEPWVRAGVPVVISYAWKKDLTGAPLSSSPGHLAVVVGFDASGNPIVNDPAAAADQDVQRTYLRSELEPLWLTSSGGTAYVMFPAGYPVPAL